MRSSGVALRGLGAALILVVGVVHLEQYLDFIKDVPTVGVLFLLNAFGAGAICIALATRLRLLAAAGGIGLVVGALVSIAIAHWAQGGFFNYQEPSWRAAVVIAVVAEIAALVGLAAYLLRARRGRRAVAPA